MTRQTRNDPGLLNDPGLDAETPPFIAELEADGLFIEGVLKSEEAFEPEVNHSKHSGDRQFDAAQIYLKDAQRSKLLTVEEEQYYGRLTQQGNEAARQKMIQSNLRLVVSLSWRYLNRGLPLMDMIEEGNIGLIRAVEKFKPELGFRFSTYAAWWIRQSIERAIMNQSRTIRLPINVLKEMNAYLKVFRHLANSLEHPPTALDVAKHMDKPVSDVEKMMKLSERVVPGDLPKTWDSERSMVDTLADEDKPTLPDITHREGMASHLGCWLDQLTEQQREVISRCYGLRGYDQASVPEIAKAMGTTSVHIRQLQVKSMTLLRKLAIKEGLSVDSIFF